MNKPGIPISKTALPAALFLVTVFFALTERAAPMGLAFVLFLGSLGFAAAQISRSRVASTQSLIYELDNESRGMIAPLIKLSEEIRTLVDSASSSTTLKVIGPDAVTESQNVVAQCARMLQARSTVLRSEHNRESAEKDLADLTLRIGSAQSVEEHSALQSSIDARQREIAAYDSLKSAVPSVEGSLRQANAVLSEIKARLALAVTGVGTETGSGDFADSLARLKTLGVSFTEAEEMLKEQAK